MILFVFRLITLLEIVELTITKPAIQITVLPLLITLLIVFQDNAPPMDAYLQVMLAAGHLSA